MAYPKTPVRQLLCFCIPLLLLSFIGCNNDDGSLSPTSSASMIPPYEKPNLPPVIEIFSCSDNSACPCAVVDLTVEAYDPEGADLTYTYASSGGICEGQSATACWSLPESEGVYKAFVVVSDGKNKVIGSLEVDVRRHPLYPYDR